VNCFISELCAGSRKWVKSTRLSYEYLVQRVRLDDNRVCVQIKANKINAPSDKRHYVSISIHYIDTKQNVKNTLT